MVVKPNIKILGIIPARYGSTRFPGKPLVMIQGKSMIRHVYEKASASDFLSEAWVATDDETIYNHVHSFGGKVVLTATFHRSGTERCLEAVSKIKGEDPEKDDPLAVINIQGDEPFIHPRQIDQVARLVSRPEVEIATLIKMITKQEELFNPNVVKVVANNEKIALYFSRSPIPYVRNLKEAEWLHHHRFFKHIGIYGYKLSILKKIVQLPESPLENAESLEQLRWIGNGFKIHTEETVFESISIDTPEDLLKITNIA